MKIPTTITLEPDVRAALERERRRRGSVLVEIKVDAGILDRLIGIEMLSVDQRTDRAAVGAAVLRCVQAGERSSTSGAIAFAEMLAERRLHGGYYR